jgi:hypothetical protein
MALLRDDGYDAISSHDIGAQHQIDEWHLQRATDDGRVLFTYNARDFEALARHWAEEGRPHAGILTSYRQYSSNEMGLLRRVLVAFQAERTAEEMANIFLTLPRPSTREASP